MGAVVCRVLGHRAVRVVLGLEVLSTDPAYGLELRSTRSRTQCRRCRAVLDRREDRRPEYRVVHRAA